jgi:hypothetical protein
MSPWFILPTMLIKNGFPAIIFEDFVVLFEEGPVP